MNIIGEIYNRYAHLVLGVCLKYLKDKEEARDACMQIFEKLISDLKTTEIDFFKAWLHTVTRNHCLIQIRNNITLEKRRQEILKFYSEEFVNFWVEMNHIHEGESEIIRINDAMGKLPQEQRLCVELIYFQDKSYKQISETTGFDINKVKSCIQNGKRNLKILLEKEYGKA